MRKSKAAPRTPKAKVLLPGSIIDGLDREIDRLEAEDPHCKLNRSSLAAQLIKRGLLRRVEGEDRVAAYEEIVQEAAALKNKGREAQREGDNADAQSLFLKAAAAELEALAVLGIKDENAIKTTIIEVLVLVKSATGYRNLPDVPTRAERVRIS